MNPKKKSRFINLAEQLTLQNEIVDSTMDRMLRFLDDARASESDSESCSNEAKPDDQSTSAPGSGRLTRSANSLGSRRPRWMHPDRSNPSQSTR